VVQTEPFNGHSKDQKQFRFRDLQVSSRFDDLHLKEADIMSTPTARRSICDTGRAAIQALSGLALDTTIDQSAPFRVHNGRSVKVPFL
jgi:hypothetical protein